MLPKVTFYYDIISPYSWIGFETLLRYQQKQYFNLKLKPVFLGGIFKETSNKSPLMVPAKSEYVMKELGLTSDYYGMKIVPPKDFIKTAFTQGSLNALRFLVALENENEKHLIPASRELWNRLWSRQESAYTENDFIEVGTNIGLNKETIDNVLKNTSSLTVKEKIKTSTMEAVAEGAFGVPWIVVEKADGVKRSFFGSDKMPLICFFIDKPFLGPLVQNECKNKL
ncbi:Glutathione S-transferase kappa 1 [Strongyloides ratti]|uniref:Glutathione S-transferase kappa n=1 Tax=Strongyloides ratti TaxID=34506 RepID=A0A090MXK1_STRRB|nr:Glutathione S-transferase kappa 1 [Strongyloides ratti]CEF65574.1 Glutathione S-transferase kappa 1 [Strongyloides ratti]